MKFCIECNTWEELVEAAKKILGSSNNKSEQVIVSTAPAIIPYEPEDVAAPEEPEEKKYTMTEVRKYLGDLRKAGKKEAVTSLISSMGYSKFTDIPEDMYPELMKKAEEL